MAKPNNKISKEMQMLQTNEAKTEFARSDTRARARKK